MTAKLTLKGTGVSVGVEVGISAEVPGADGVEVGCIGVGDRVSLGVGEGSGVAVGSGVGVVELQAASKKTHIAEMAITQTAFSRYLPRAITRLTCPYQFAYDGV
jgi:hypothetical protein